MKNQARARELALEGAVIAFFAIILLGLLAGAESYVAALRGLAAGALVAFGGPFPIRIALDALEPPAEPPTQQEADSRGQEAGGRRQEAGGRRQ